MLVDILGSILSKLEKNIWRKFCSRTFTNLENAKLFTLLLLLLVLSPCVTLTRTGLIYIAPIVRLRVHFSRHCDFNQISD